MLTMVLMTFGPFITKGLVDGGTLVSSLGLVAAAYLGGQGAVDAVGIYRQGKKE